MLPQPLQVRRAGRGVPSPPSQLQEAGRNHGPGSRMVAAARAGSQQRQARHSTWLLPACPRQGTGLGVPSAPGERQRGRALPWSRTRPGGSGQRWSRAGRRASLLQESPRQGWRRGWGAAGAAGKRPSPAQRGGAGQAAEPGAHTRGLGRLRAGGTSRSSQPAGLNLVDC